MSSQVDIVNFGLTVLGQNRIASMTENTKPAREARAVFDMTRDALIANYDWTFAKDRGSLPALVDAPAFGYGAQYQLPTDCLRLISLGDIYVGVDLTNYRTMGPPAEFEIEDDKILTNLGAPLNIRFAKRITDPGKFSAPFAVMLGIKVAYHVCEALTGSNTKRDLVERAEMKALKEAIRANAIQLPPQKFADSEWITSRM